MGRFHNGMVGKTVTTGILIVAVETARTTLLFLFTFATAPSLLPSPRLFCSCFSLAFVRAEPERLGGR